MKRKRILVVEDEAVTGIDLQLRLNQLGYEVPAIATNGSDAVRLAAELHPDLILMDITLEGPVSGIEAADSIQKSDKIPVVFVTAHDDMHTIKRATASGPYGYITKPYNLSVLQSTIEVALYKSEMDARVREKNAELERFTYTVSHDLKSPLITFKTYLGYLEQDMVKADAERIKQDLGFMRTAADKMEELLGGILAFSRIGRVENTAVNVSFRELAEEAIAAVAGQIAQKKAMVHVGPLDLALYGDRLRLVDIWQNLIDNAVKYTGGQEHPHIELGAEREGQGAIFFVRDNGMGIDPRHKDRVFGLFDKLDPKSEGSGLGLALVKRIVELYAGKIWVESEGLGKGTCVKFTLPSAIKNYEL